MKRPSLSGHPLVELQKLGQSPWYDNIRRGLLTSGELKTMVKAGDITGLTSNPAIFEQAIAHSTDYAAAIETLARTGQTADVIVETLAVEDIQAAADVLAPVFKRTRGGDGYVSLEVAPRYAHDTAATIQEAQRLWTAVDRPNLMIKIPATTAGVPAVEQVIAAGINVNVTLIFSLERYRAVMEAYLRGLEARVTARQPVASLASVASFFISRVDTAVDARLETLRSQGAQPASALSGLNGQAAIANAKLAYAEFQRVFASERFAALAAHGARVQRPLWASTSTKNPTYPDVYYVEALVGPNTVDTLPPATLAAYKNHGRPAARLAEGLEAAQAVLGRLEAAGISMEAVTAQLEAEGVAAFQKSFVTLVTAVENRRQVALLNDRQTVQLGRYARTVANAMADLQAEQFGPRLWKKDAALWKVTDAVRQAALQQSLGWLDAVERLQGRVSELTTFAGEVRRANFTHAVVCGVGEAALAAAVVCQTFEAAKGYLDLTVLDSTDPASVLSMEGRSDPARTLYIIGGDTLEVRAFRAYFWQKVVEVRGSRAGENFVAITEAGSPLEQSARELRFRRIFLNPPGSGAGFGGVSYFSLVPAALLGVDVARLLSRAQQMLEVSGPTTAVEQNPGVRLGATLAALAQAGRDKVTLVLPDSVAAVGEWVELRLAEATGKHGRGLIPVSGEPLSPSANYGGDRVFVYWRIGPDARRDARMKTLARAGQPVITLDWVDVYDVAGDWVRWQLAAAAAAAVLGVDPLEQPDVPASQAGLVPLLERAVPVEPRLEQDSQWMVNAPGFATQLTQRLRRLKRGDYVALDVFVEPTPRREILLREVRAALRDQYGVATVAGFAPRCLYSTGQLQKGGTVPGLCLQLIDDDLLDVAVPGTAYTFSALKHAQADHDLAQRQVRRRPGVQVQLGYKCEAGLKALLALVRAGSRRSSRTVRRPKTK